MLCSNFDLQLLSFVDQTELELILNQLSLLKNLNFSEVLIGNFKEEGNYFKINDGEKVRKLAENIDRVEPNKSCLAFVKSEKKNGAQNGVFLRKVRCETRNQFICEENFKKQKTRNLKGSYIFMKPLAEFSFNRTGQLQSKLLYISHNFIKTSWLKAEEVCGSFGMDLFVPESIFELKLIQTEFQAKSDLPQSLHLGAMNIDRDYVPMESRSWYSIATNRYLTLTESDNFDEKCMILKRKNGFYSPTGASCTDQIENFVCQKLQTKRERFLRFEDSTSEDYETPYKFKWISDKSK